MSTSLPSDVYRKLPLIMALHVMKYIVFVLLPSDDTGIDDQRNRHGLSNSCFFLQRHKRILARHTLVITPLKP